MTSFEGLDLENLRLNDRHNMQRDASSPPGQHMHTPSNGLQPSTTTENLVGATAGRHNPDVYFPERDERDRTVNRRLRGIHVFMITISGVLGVGLYVRSGTILHIGGPAAVIIAFTVMGLLAWLVMQCIGEMLALWPISGALVEYVSTFVDRDLGTAVGVAYWFTYSINFAAIIVAAAGEVEFWNPPKALIGTVMFFLVPAFMVFLNSFGVQIYGLTEVIGGTLKLVGAAVVIVCMILINAGVGPGEYIGTRYYRDYSIFQLDTSVADNWAIALFISFSIATFSFIGVEIATIPAFESRYDTYRQHDGDHKTANRSVWDRITVRFSATWTSFIAWIIYFLAGIMMTFNIWAGDPELSRASWLGSAKTKQTPSDSGFVISAAKSQIPGLTHLFSVVLLITALTCANTNLYVASRTLFSLTREVDERRYPWLAFFGRTNNYQVPVRAMFISCFFIWVPFLYLSPNNSPDTTIASLLEILSQMGSVSCLIVWTCEIWAFIRFYNCMEKHKAELEQMPHFAHVCRKGKKYPWSSHGQPLTMYVALFGCLFVLIVADGAALWNGFHKTAFLSAYLAPMCFLALWFGVKVYRANGLRNIEWRLADTSNLDFVKKQIQRLDEIKQRASADPPAVNQKNGFGNLWGLF